MKTPYGIVERDGRYYMQADGREYLWDGEGVPTPQDWERRPSATAPNQGGDPPSTVDTCPQCRALFPVGEPCPACGQAPTEEPK